MRRTRFASFVFALAVGITSFGAALVAGPAPAAADLLAEPVAIFAGPGYTYPSVAGAGRGDWLTVDGPAVDGWVPVTYYGISGWIEATSLEPGTQGVPAPPGYYDFLNEDEAESGDGGGGGGGDNAQDGTVSGGDTASSGDESAAAGSGGPETVSEAPATSDPSQVESSAAGQDGESRNAQGERRNRDESGAGSGGSADSGASAGASGSSPVSEPAGGYDLAPPEGQSTVAGGASEYTEAQLLGYIYEAADAYGQDRASMERVARCESGLNPYAIDPEGLYFGLFQFVPETFAQTPYADYDIFDPWANSMAAGWMWEQGRRNEWVCQ
ncbi:MAG: transglycosylase SLT domain-containing protein [Chloroflexota bacterium]